MLWPHVREFADNALAHVAKTLAALAAAGEVCELYDIHGGGRGPDLSATGGASVSNGLAATTTGCALPEAAAGAVAALESRPPGGRRCTPAESRLKEKWNATLACL